MKIGELIKHHRQMAESHRETVKMDRAESAYDTWSKGSERAAARHEAAAKALERKARG